MEKRKEKKYEIKTNTEVVNKNPVFRSFFSKIFNDNIALALKKSSIFVVFLLFISAFVNAGDVIIQNGKINASNNFYFDGSSKVGIGTGSPSEELVLRDSDAGGGYIILENGPNTILGSALGAIGVNIYGPSGSEIPRMLFQINGSNVMSLDNNGSVIIRKNAQSYNGTAKLNVHSDGVSHAAIFNNGSVGIGTTSPNDALDVVGDIDATGCVQTDDSGSIGGTCVSDIRLKKDIKPLENSLNKIAKLRPVSFEWRENYYGISKQEGQSVGLIAQEVEKIFPELVTKEEGYKRIRYDTELEMHLIQAIKELKAENDALKRLVCQDHPEAKICK